MMWKQHPEFAFLEVSRCGKLRYCVPTLKFAAGTLIPTRVNPAGYVLASFYDPGAGKPQIYRTTHRLVAQTWKDNPDKLPIVHHLNGNKADNREANLEWVSHKQNKLYAVADGKCQYNRGEGNGHAKLTEDRVRLMRLLHKFTGISYGNLGKAFGICKMNAWNIVNGRRWAHVEGSRA